MFYFCHALRRHQESETAHAGDKCRGSYPMEVVDRAIYTYFEGSLNNPRLIEASVKNYNESLKSISESPELQALESRVSDLRKKISNLLDQAEAGVDVKDRLEQRRAELTSAEALLIEMKSKRAQTTPLDAKVRSRQVNNW